MHVGTIPIYKITRSLSFFLAGISMIMLYLKIYGLPLDILIMTVTILSFLSSIIKHKYYGQTDLEAPKCNPERCSRKSRQRRM